MTWPLQLASRALTTTLCLVVQDLELEYVVSPHTPLLSTAVEENGWACGEFWLQPVAGLSLQEIDCLL